MVDECIGFGVSPRSLDEVVFALKVVVFGFPIVDECMGFGVSPWSLGVEVFRFPVVDGGIDAGVSAAVPVVVEAAPAEGVGFCVWFGPSEVFGERGRGVSSMVIPVEVVDGFAFGVYVVAIGLGVSSMGVPGIEVVEDTIGFGVSSVEGGLLGVEVFGFSDVDGCIGRGVSSILLVVVEAAPPEGVGLGVWFDPGEVDQFSVLTIGVPGVGVVEDPIGFGVSSVEDGFLGVEVFWFSVVDGSIGGGVSSSLLVVVKACPAEGVCLGVWFDPGVVETLSVLIIGVVVGGF